MGNRYSFVREEEEEAEFRRLVEAVEIAQRRTTGHGDIEAGLYRPPGSAVRAGDTKLRPNALAGNDGRYVLSLWLTITLTRGFHIYCSPLRRPGCTYPLRGCTYPLRGCKSA